MTPYQLMLRSHQFLYRRSGGLVGHRLLGVPTLLLTTAGRRSGRRRINALIYANVGDQLAVVASNGGRDAPPGWLLNLAADPRVAVQIGRHRSWAVAQVVPPGHARYTDLLGRCDAVNRGRYSEFQQLTHRPIPIVVLTPVMAHNWTDVNVGPSP